MSVPAVQRRAQQEEITLRVAANGGTGHHTFRTLSTAVAISSSVLLSTAWAWNFNPCASRELSSDELATLTSFRCREALTYRPGDRGVLLAEIRKEWGSEEAFDAFVQRELPPILAGNKQRYASRLGRVVSEHIDLAFGG